MTGFQEVDIAPVADLDRLTLVQVVLYRPPVIDNRPVGTSTTTTTTHAPDSTETTVTLPEPPAPTAPPRTTVTQVGSPTSAPTPTTSEAVVTEPEGAAGPVGAALVVESFRKLPAATSGLSSTKLSDVSELDGSAP